MTFVQLRSVSVTQDKPNSLVENIAYSSVERCIITRCTGVGEAWSRIAEVNCDPTHYTETRSDMRPASTCSTPSLQRGQVLLRR